MDLKTLLDNLHEEVSCSVCMTTFTEPKQLPCLHSFCLHCLEGILRTSGRQDIIACPKCRREIRLPASGNLNDLPTNFRINSLLDVLAIKECNTTGVKCGNCDKKSAQSLYCFQCSSFWCDFCITGHNIIRTNAGHRVLALKDFEDQDIEDVLKRPAFCQQKHHENEELKFFCKDCEVAICHSCVATIHEGHAKILLEEAASERKLHVQIFIESLKQIAEEKLEKIGKLDGLITKVEENVGNVKREVEIYAASMVAVIEAKKAEIFYELDFKADESIEHLAQNRTETGDQVDMVYTEIEKSESFLKRSTSAEIVQFDGLLDTIRFQEDPDPPRIPCFRFVGCVNNFCNLKTNGIGSVKVFFPGFFTLYVKNLDSAIDNERLRKEFSTYGTVINAKVAMDDKSNSKGFGFVSFSSKEEATRALTEMNGRSLLSRVLYVAEARRSSTSSP